MPDSLTTFADKISEIMPAMAREFLRLQSDELFKGTITLAQFLVLDFLHKQGLSKMTAVAEFMRASTAAATGTVERLVKSGFARRVFYASDRRIVNIELTAKGEAVVKKVYQQRRQMTMRIFKELSQQERDSYLGILKRIHEVVASQQ